MSTSCEVSFVRWRNLSLFESINPDDVPFRCDVALSLLHTTDHRHELSFIDSINTAQLYLPLISSHPSLPVASAASCVSKHSILIITQRSLHSFRKARQICVNEWNNLNFYTTPHRVTNFHLDVRACLETAWEIYSHARQKMILKASQSSQIVFKSIRFRRALRNFIIDCSGEVAYADWMNLSEASRLKGKKKLFHLLPFLALSEKELRMSWEKFVCTWKLPFMVLLVIFLFALFVVFIPKRNRKWFEFSFRLRREKKKRKISAGPKCSHKEAQ